MKVRIYVDCIKYEALSEEAYRRKTERLIETGLEDKQAREFFKFMNIDYDRAKTDREYCAEFVDKFMFWKYTEMDLQIY